MALTVPAPVAAHIASVESSLAPVDEIALAGKLERAVGDAKDLTTEERRGCMAEIMSLQLRTMPSDDRGPWDCALYAGLGVGLVKDLPSAGDLVRRLWAECEAATS